MKFVRNLVLVLIPLFFIFGCIRILFIHGGEDGSFLPSLDGFMSWINSFPSSYIANNIISDIDKFKIIVDSSFNSSFWDALVGIFKILGNCWNMLVDIIRIPVYVFDWIIRFGHVV